MTGTIAHSALLVSVAVVALGIVLTPVAVRTERRHLLQLVYGAVYTNFLLATIATIAMIVALVTHDFSVSYVAAVGSRSTPLLFTIISFNRGTNCLSRQPRRDRRGGCGTLTIA